MTPYASNTRTRRNLAMLEKHSWRILVTPDNPKPPNGFLFGIDNGAWKARNGSPFDEVGFERLVEKHGPMADFVVIPDIVAGGRKSLEFSVSWLPKLRGLRRLLLPVQDGMNSWEVGDVLREWTNTGLFLGGSTDWKLATMYAWGMMACSARRYYHVGRVNSARRIRLAAEAGADSFDGTSATMFSCTVPLLEAARSQPSLLVPSMCMKW